MVRPRVHGYRRAHSVGGRTLCRTCGRLRRRLVSVPACIRGCRGSFRQDDESVANKAIHQLAPPCQASGTTDLVRALSQPDPDISTNLFQSLAELDGVADHRGIGPVSRSMSSLLRFCDALSKSGGRFLQTAAGTQMCRKT